MRTRIKTLLITGLLLSLIDGFGQGESTYHLITESGDTLPTGAPIPIEGKWMDPDSVSRPQAIPIKGSPRVTLSRTQKRLAGQGRKRLLPHNLPFFTPGRNGVPLPDTVPAIGSSRPAVHPKPVLATAPRFKDLATKGIRYLNTEQGLNAVAVICLQEDRNGRLWMGTWEGGVSCYDGTYLSHFTTTEGLSDNRVYSILEDSRGYLWFGTFGGGVTCYDGKDFTIYNTAGGLLNDWVFAIVEDDQGNIWFGTVYGACQLVINGPLDQPGNQFVHYTTRQGLSGDHIQSMIKDQEGGLWIGTFSGGVTHFDGQSFVHYTTEQGLSRNDVRSLHQDQQSRIWMGTNGGGLHILDGQELVHYTQEDGLNHNTIMAITEDKEGAMYIGSLAGLNIFDGKKLSSFQTEEGLSNNNILSLKIQDRTGNLWIGTDGGGLNQLNRGKWYLENQNFVNGMTKAIIEDDRGQIWLGTYGGGVVRYDGRQFTNLLQKNGLIDDKVDDLLLDRNNHLWVGTSTGLSRFDGQSFTNYTTKEGLGFDIINDLYEDSKGNIWIGTNGGGLSRYDGKSFTNYLLVPDLPFNFIKNILEDKQGNIWLASEKGLIRFDGQAYTFYTTNEGLIDNKVFALYLDQLGRLWVGTEGGVSIFDARTVRFTNFTEAEGLCHNNIRSFREDHKGHIWVVTEKGITILSPSGRPLSDGVQAAFQFTVYGPDGDLKTSMMEKGICLDQNNHLWMGTKGGAVRLNLNDFRYPGEPPANVQLSHLEIGQRFIAYNNLQDTAYRQAFSFGKALRRSFDSVAAFYNYPLRPDFPHHLDHLTFYFSAIDWQGSQKLQYSYKMDGLEEKWSPLTTEPKADYRNLPAGSYAFQLKALGATGTWSEVFTYPFDIRPPWWQSWWAYCLYGLLSLLALFGLYQYQKKRWLLQVSLEREQEESLRLRELDEFKSRFYTNITHEFRTPLTVIQGLTEQIRENPRWKITEKLDLIRNNSNKLLELINQLLDLSKVEAGKLDPKYVQGDVIQYLSYLVESFHSLALEQKITLSFYAHQEQLVMDYDPEKYQQIVSNLVSNAIKFTPIYGKISVVARAIELEGSKWLEIRVRDSGIGMSEDQLTHIFDRFYQADNSTARKAEGTGLGLALVKELIELMNGRINVKSTIEIGTCFTVQLPINHTADLTSWQPPETGTTAARQAVASPSFVVPAEESPLALIVEDNQDIIYYLRSCLEGAYQIEEARNGRTGIEKAIENIPDVIISDVMMPEVDGFELCQTLKADERTSHIPIILLTAKATREDRLEGLSQGADAYLAKPFEKAELLIRLEKLIELRRRLQHRYQSRKEVAEAPEDAFLSKVRKAIETHLEDADFNVQFLARKLGLSRVQLHRKLKALTDSSTTQFIRAIQMEKAWELLKSTDLTIAEIGYQLGFKDPSHFTRSFSKHFGESPSETRS